jgi:hypothetical protein
LSALHKPGSCGRSFPGIDDSPKITADQTSAGAFFRPDWGLMKLSYM